MIRFAFDLTASQAKSEDDPKLDLLAQVIHALLLRPLQAESNRMVGGVSGRIPLAQLQIVPRFQARVLVRLRPSVLDPAGEAARAAASRLDVEGLASLRIGKAVEMKTWKETLETNNLNKDRRFVLNQPDNEIE